MSQVGTLSGVPWGTSFSTRPRFGDQGSEIVLAFFSIPLVIFFPTPWLGGEDFWGTEIEPKKWDAFCTQKRNRVRGKYLKLD